jgi:hypothetical protein
MSRVVTSRVVRSVLAMIVAPAMTIVATNRAVIARAMSTVATNRAVMSLVVTNRVVTNRVVIVLHAPSVAGATSPVVTNPVVMSRAATNRAVTNPVVTNPVVTAVTSVPLVTMVAASAWASTKSVRLRRRLARWRLPVRSRRPQQLRLAPRPVRLLLSPVTTSV